MKILVTGANGFLGRYVVQALMRRGHTVRALVRQPHRLGATHGGDLEEVQGDLLGGGSLISAMADVQAVIHLALDMRAPPDLLLRSALDGTKHLIGAMPSEGARLVLASSFAVYDWMKVTGALTEASPTLAVNESRIAGAYAHAKVAQEALAMTLCAQRHIGLTILRPATIWGVGHPGLDVVGPGNHRLRVVMSPTRATQLTYVEHCADAFVAALGDQSDAGVFNVEDGFGISAASFVRQVQPEARTVGLPAGLMRGLALAGPLTHWAWRKGWPVPGLLIPERLAARFPRVPVDTTKLQRDLGWRPRHDFGEAIRRARLGATTP